MPQLSLQTVPVAWLLVWLVELPGVVEFGCQSVWAREEGGPGWVEPSLPEGARPAGQWRAETEDEEWEEWEWEGPMIGGWGWEVLGTESAVGQV